MNDQDRAAGVPQVITCSGGCSLPPLCVSFGDDQEGQDNG